MFDFTDPYVIIITVVIFIVVILLILYMTSKKETEPYSVDMHQVNQPVATQAEQVEQPKQAEQPNIVEAMGKVGIRENWDSTKTNLAPMGELANGVTGAMGSSYTGVYPSQTLLTVDASGNIDTVSGQDLLQNLYNMAYANWIAHRYVVDVINGWPNQPGGRQVGIIERVNDLTSAIKEIQTYLWGSSQAPREGITANNDLEGRIVAALGTEAVPTDGVITKGIATVNATAIRLFATKSVNGKLVEDLTKPHVLQRNNMKTLDMIAAGKQPIQLFASANNSIASGNTNGTEQPRPMKRGTGDSADFGDGSVKTRIFQILPLPVNSDADWINWVAPAKTVS